MEWGVWQLIKTKESLMMKTTSYAHALNCSHFYAQPYSCLNFAFAVMSFVFLTTFHFIYTSLAHYLLLANHFGVF